MEEMMCWSCKRSRTGINPKNIEDIDNNCELPSILRSLEIDENRLHCPHYSMNEKVCNREIILDDVSKNIKDSYPDGKCPDCGESIPDNIVGGDKCSNCGHVFHSLDFKNIKGLEELRSEGYMQRKQGWKKEMGL
jgi:hypothetical protein